MFVKTVHQIITGASKSYAAVIVSQTRSGGSGLSAQAGLTGVAGVIDVFRAEEAADRKNGVQREPWQVKHFVAIQSGSTQQLQRSVGGKLATSVLFFYRGEWPAKMKVRRRQHLTGTTWDDVFPDVPVVQTNALRSVPKSLQALIMADAWAAYRARGASANKGGGKDAAPANGGDGPVGDAEEEKPSKYQRKHNAGAGTKKRKTAEKNKKDQKKTKKKQLGLKFMTRQAAEDITTWTKQGFAKLPKPPVWEQAAKDPTDLPVVLLRNDCHPLLYKQIFLEWNARAVAVWTTGQGTALIAAQEELLPGLGFVLNQPHHDVVRYWLESACAKTVVEVICK